MSQSPPLAARMRPTRLDQIVGQERWLGEGAPLSRMLSEGTMPSLVLWGPPGCGKTTTARLLASSVGAHFEQFSAVLDGIKQLRKAVEEAEHRSAGLHAQATVIFVDEIHRWNKAQQDALLPHVESGAITLIGATTENPSFSLNPALRSRVQLIHLDPLTPGQVRTLLERALEEDAQLLQRELTVDDTVLDALAQVTAGDARQALSYLERAFFLVSPGATLTMDTLEQVLAEAVVRHDQTGEDHYNVTSALIKSMRGSDPQAALYWLARLLAGGDDPAFLARRLIIFASEDIGNADPRALGVATDAARAVQLIGMPEARIVLGQAVTFLACSPKSNAAYMGINKALDEVRRTGALPVPLHLRNAPTDHMKQEGYGAGYLYPHDHPHHIVAQQYLPDRLQGRTFYQPAPHGEEKTIAARLDWWQRKLQSD